MLGFAGQARPSQENAGKNKSGSRKDSPSLHAIESVLEDVHITGVTKLLSGLLDPFLFQRILRRSVILIEYPKHSRKRQLREFIGSELVGDVVAEFVLGGVVVFLFLDQLEAAAF